MPVADVNRIPCVLQILELGTLRARVLVALGSQWGGDSFLAFELCLL